MPHPGTTHTGSRTSRVVRMRTGIVRPRCPTAWMSAPFTIALRIPSPAKARAVATGTGPTPGILTPLSRLDASRRQHRMVHEHVHHRSRTGRTFRRRPCKLHERVGRVGLGRLAPAGGTGLREDPVLPGLDRCNDDGAGVGGQPGVESHGAVSFGPMP